MSADNLSSAEIAAIENMKHSGIVLINQIPEKTTKDQMDSSVPGINIYKKLANKGYCYLIEEEPLDDGFVFTDSYSLTEKGENLTF